MFQTERVPVTVYRSTDEGAPQLSAAPGSLKTVLKACLTNGYGTKQPLGWEMQYENGHAACWRSKHNRATGAVLSLDDKGGYGLMQVFQTASSATTGDKPLIRYSSGDKFSYFSSYLSRVSANAWVLVGHARGFVLILPTDKNAVVPFLIFGDYAGLGVSHQENVFLAGSFYNGEDYGRSSSTYYSFTYDYLGTKQGIYASMVSLADTYGGKYPSPVANGFSASEIYLAEGGAGKSTPLRGLLPGILRIAEEMPDFTAVPVGTVYDNLDASGDAYLAFSTNSTSRVNALVNLTAWEL